VQGFPSLFNYQNNLFEKFKTTILLERTTFINGIAPEQYLQIEDAICNNHPKENVILLEIEPEKQNTKLISITKRDIGIPIVCITELSQKRQTAFFMKMTMVMKFL
jgi:hypothetical protein